MSSRNKFAKTAATAALAFGLSAGLSAVASAQSATFPVQIVNESDSTGFVGAIPGSAPAIMVASDGESPFDPFSVGFDTSDGIQLDNSWVAATPGTGAFAPGFWEEITGTTVNTWVLPAVTPCGGENSVTCEPVAEWIFPGASWASGAESLQIMEADGSLSDLVTIANNGPNGSATITFASDPFGVPEPATWALMLAGVGLIGAGLRSRRMTALSVA